MRIQKRVKDARQLDLLADRPDRIPSMAISGFWEERSNEYRDWMRNVQFMSGPGWVVQPRPVSPTIAFIQSQMRMMVEHPAVIGRFDGIMGLRQIPDPPVMAAVVPDSSSAFWPDGWDDE